MKVLKINKFKVCYFFSKLGAIDPQFFTSCELEFRLTLGPDWNNYLAVNKGYFLNPFAEYEFSRNTEAMYTRHVVMFTEQLESVRMQVSLGVEKGTERDVGELAELKSYVSEDVYLPPEHFFTKEISATPLPP